MINSSENLKLIDEFVDNAGKLGVELSDKQVEQFIIYYEMLVETNKMFNLTAITEFDQVLNKHFIDSISIAKQKGFINANKIIDVGSGAGFPGIPIKIAFPDKEVLLADSLNKRVGFLNNVIDKLELTKISAVHGRVEDLAADSRYREKFDLSLSRAVARLASLSEYCIPFVCKGGYFIAYKSEKAKEELAEANKALKVLGGKFDNVDELTLPNSDDYRCFINIKKIETTPKKYPRKAGTPTKSPII